MIERSEESPRIEFGPEIEQPAPVVLEEVAKNIPDESGRAELTRRGFLIGGGSLGLIAGTAVLLKSVGSKKVGDILEEAKDVEQATRTIEIDPLSYEQRQRIKRLRSGKRPEMLGPQEIIATYKPLGERMPDVDEPVGTSLIQFMHTKDAIGQNRISFNVDAPKDSIVLNGRDYTAIRKEQPRVMINLRKDFNDLIELAKSDAEIADYMADLFSTSRFDPTINAPEMYFHQMDTEWLNAYTEIRKSFQANPDAAINGVTQTESVQMLFNLAARDRDPADAFKFSDHIIANFFEDDYLRSSNHLGRMRDLMAETKAEVIDGYAEEAKKRGYSVPADEIAFVLNNTEDIVVDYFQAHLRRLRKQSGIDSIGGGRYSVLNGVVVMFSTVPNKDSEANIRDTARHEYQHAMTGVQIARRDKAGKLVFHKTGMITNSSHPGKDARRLGYGAEEQMTEYFAERDERFNPQTSGDYDRVTEDMDGVYLIHLLDTLTMDLGVGNIDGRNSSKIASFGKQVIDPDLFFQYKTSRRAPVRRPLGDIVKTHRINEFEYQQKRRNVVQPVDTVYGRGFYNRLMLFLDKSRAYGTDKELVPQLIEHIMSDRRANQPRTIYGQGVIDMPWAKKVTSTPTNLGKNIYFGTNNFINQYLALPTKSSSKKITL